MGIRGLARREEEISAIVGNELSNLTSAVGIASKRAR